MLKCGCKKNVEGDGVVSGLARERFARQFYETGGEERLGEVWQ